MSKLLRVFHVFREQTIAQMSQHLHKFSKKGSYKNPYIYKEMAANKFYNSLTAILFFYLPSQASGFSFAVSLRNWN